MGVSLPRRRADGDPVSWQPDWEPPSRPCAYPETCGAQQPICVPCIEGKAAYLKENPDGDWAALEEWKRDSWRVEAASP